MFLGGGFFGLFREIVLLFIYLLIYSFGHRVVRGLGLEFAMGRDGMSKALRFGLYTYIYLYVRNVRTYVWYVYVYACMRVCVSCCVVLRCVGSFLFLDWAERFNSCVPYFFLISHFSFLFFLLLFLFPFFFPLP